MFASTCDDITFLVNYIMLRPSASAVLFDPSKQTPSPDRFLRGQIGDRESARSFYLCLGIDILKLVVNMMTPAGPLWSSSPCAPGRDPKLLVATTPFGTFKFGMLAELFNHSAVRGVLMRVRSKAMLVLPFLTAGLFTLN